MVMAIRRALPGDAEEVWRMHTECIRTCCSSSYSSEEIEAWCGALSPEKYREALRGGLDFFVAHREEEILGICLFSLQEEELFALYVSPAFTGQGVGTRLLEYVESLGIRRSLPGLTVRSTVNAESFYARQGFVRQREECHELPGGRGLRCIRMYKKLAGKSPETPEGEGKS